MPQLHRVVAGAVALAVAGALAAAPTAGAAPTPGAAAPSQVTSYADDTGACAVTLPGGTHAIVTDHDGRQTAQLTDADAAHGGMISVDDGGHDVLLPAAQLSAVAKGTVDVAAYDTALLAQRQCGWTAPRTPNHAPAGYQLGRLTIHTLGLDGQPMAGFVMLTNVDNENLARPIVDNTAGITKIAVPDGHYAAMLVYQTSATAYRFVVDPDFTVTDGTDITLDARTATVTANPPTTPKAATLQSASFGVSRGDGVNVADWFDYFDLDPTPVTFSINPLPAVRHGVQVINPDYEFASPDGDYAYHITEPVDHVTTAGFPTSVDPARLATVTRHYNAAGAGGPVLSANIGEPRAEAAAGLFGLRGISLVDLGTTRTEYFSASPDIVWLSIEDSDAVSDEEIYTSPTVYLPGQHTTQTFHRGADHPGVALDTVGAHTTCGACSSGSDLQFDLYPFNDNNPGDYAVLGGAGTASFSLSRNGSLIASDDVQPQFVGVPVPHGTAKYQLTSTVDRCDPLPLATSTSTTWTFTANPGHGGRIPANWTCPDGGTDCSTLPLLFAYYTVDTTANDVLAAGAHTLDLDVQHQQHAQAAPLTGASVSVSYDDGATWTPAS
ncbi:MAG TPA: hypothetical protein VHF06_20555, partial [Pseudonocardiaceae bacterium]|nr:hypothetical protein [Pseudonocardiaceae bacterium]